MKKIKCQVFDIDISELTTDQIKERCQHCLEKSEGEQCHHLIFFEESGKVIEEQFNKLKNKNEDSNCDKTEGRQSKIADLA